MYTYSSRFQLFESKGTKFRFNSNVATFNGQNGALVSVTLADKEVIPADLCIIGIGTQTDTDYITKSGIEFEKRGNVLVNAKMETNLPNIYAGGDLVAFPIKGKLASIGHWQIAQTHGIKE